MKRLMFGLVFLCLVVISTTKAATTNSVTLAWDASCYTNLTGYYLYYSQLGVLSTNVRTSFVDECSVTRSAKTNIYRGNYSPTNRIFSGLSATATVTNLVYGSTNYFVVIASTTISGFEVNSDFSEEISYVVASSGKPLKPLNFKINP